MKNMDSTDPLGSAATVSGHLKIADRLVKSGDIESALKEVRAARSMNPRNLYALAYEERLKTLLDQKAAGRAPKSSPDAEVERAELEKIRHLAEDENNRRAAEKARRQEEEESKRREADERSQVQTARKAALQQKVSEYLRKAEESFSAGEFDRALEEVDRAALIDPSAEGVAGLKTRITEEREAIRHREEAEKVRHEAEVVRRRQLVREQLEKELLGEEGRRRAEAEAKAEAQRRKMNACVAKAREYRAAGNFDDALIELAFALVLDPLNEVVLALQQEISKEQDEVRRLQEGARRKEEERIRAEEEERTDALQKEVSRYIERASSLADGGKFDLALDEIARAYIINPLAPDLQVMEEKIRAEQTRVRAEEEELRRRAEDEGRRRLEEEMRLQEEEALRKLQERQERERTEDERRLKEEKVRTHIKRSQACLEQGRLEEALGEIALAFVVDPLHPEVNALEAKVREAQRRHREEETRGEAASGEVHREGIRERDRVKVSQLKETLDWAGELMEAGEFDGALDETAKAFAIDPMSIEARELDAEIRKRIDASAKKGEEPPAPVGAESTQAGTAEPDQDLKGNGTWSEIDEILARAEQLLEQEEFDLALDEVAAAYAIDPLDPVIAVLDESIRIAQERKLSGEDTDDPRRIVSPRPGKRG